MAGQGLMYSCTLGNTSWGTASTDVWVLGTSAAVPVLIHEIRMTANQTVDTRTPLQICRRTAGPTGGAAVTARPLNLRNSVAAASTITSLPATPGAIGNLLENELWSQLVPFSRIYTPDERIYVPISAWVALFLPSAPAAVNVSWDIFFEEL